jgi:three-Cys-motif partner protein
MPKKSIILDPNDRLIVDEVGPWVSEKHDRLKKYIDAYRSVRALYLPPKGTGGAGYIELFSGPGRSQIKGTDTFVDGSPIVAYKAAQRSRTHFSEIHLNDIDSQKASALKQRITALGGAVCIYSKPAEVAVDEIVDALNPWGLHFAFLDPYKLEVLPFSIIRKLATVRKMDMLIHVSVFDLQRNLRRYVADGKVLDSFMPGWSGSVDVNRPDHGLRTELLDYWLGEIRKLGASPAEGIELVSGPGGQRLYWLVFVSAHPLGRKLWEDIRNVNVQARML